MALEKKRQTSVKREEEKQNQSPKINLDDIDLGDADGSSGNLGMDNFKPEDKNQLPSEKGRIEEL